MNELEQLLPHRGTAVMLDSVIRWDERELLACTRSHRCAENPLRHGGRLAAVHLVEYGAQAMAVHGALRARAAGAAPASALLVAVRHFETTRNYIDDLPGDLEIVARQLLAAQSGWQYEFEALHAGAWIARGRVAAMIYALPTAAAPGNSNSP